MQERVTEAIRKATGMQIEPIALAISLVIGAIVGMGYFAGLWITVQKLPQAKRPVVLWAVSALLRAAGATAIFVVLMGWGALNLVAGGIGFLGARVLSAKIWGSVREPRIPGARSRNAED